MIVGTDSLAKNRTPDASTHPIVLELSKRMASHSPLGSRPMTLTGSPRLSFTISLYELSGPSRTLSVSETTCAWMVSVVKVRREGVVSVALEADGGEAGKATGV